MSGPEMICRDEERRARSRVLLNGIDYVEVSDDQLVLHLSFFQKAPTDLVPENVVIAGGARIPRVKVVEVRPCPPDQRDHEERLHIVVEAPGDFSTYTLSLVEIDAEGAPTTTALSGLDPRYSRVQFTFKASCRSDLDCQPADVCPPPDRQEPNIDYLAKDYASFRQLVLDRLAVVMPDWTERHVPDIGIALVEVFAYVGDYLSYQQDAVATEAYLGTARQRISVRRHARLVDYLLHEGVNARAWIHVWTADDQALNPESIFFISADTDVPASWRTVLSLDDIVKVPFDRYEIFEPVDRITNISLHAGLNEIAFYTWGDRQCCLPAGATSATLKDVATPAQGLPLAEGNFLLFEEVRGPNTGNPADADPNHRHIVQLTHVERNTDPVDKQPIIEIEWAADDALPFSLCLSAIVGDACETVDVSVARGNMVLVDHGRTVAGEALGLVPRTLLRTGCEGAHCPGEITATAGRFGAELKWGPLVYSLPFDRTQPASQQIVRQPDTRIAQPAIQVSSIPPAPGGADSLVPFEMFSTDNWTAFAATLRDPKTPAHQFLRAWLGLKLRTRLGEGKLEAAALRDAVSRLRQPWRYRADLIGSTALDRDYTIEVDNDGHAHLRFGDGELGRQPEAGTAFEATYRVGSAAGGNVGAEHISRIVFKAGSVSGFDLRPRNPLPAAGGIPPETLAEARLFAPHRFRTDIRRAITADDYATLAERHPKVQRAAAVLRWTGNGYEALVALDQRDQSQVDDGLLTEVAIDLDDYRRIGHSVRVVPARMIPLVIKLTICVLPHYLRAHVKAAVLDVLSNRRLADGRVGAFHPDNLSFGQPIYMSPIVAMVQAVPGVESVVVDRLERLFDGPAGEIARGLLPIGPLEIARLDNDPSLPENGRLELDMRGGR